MAVLSLALGLGLVTAMFAILDAATHPWVPYRDADRLYEVRYWMSGRDQRFSPAWVIAALRERTRAFQAILPYGGAQMSLGGEGGVPGSGADILVAKVTPSLLGVLGVRPRLGRLLDNADVGAGAVLLSDGVWRRLFPGRRGVDGASVLLGDTRYAVVGVMPPGMRFPWSASAWMPVSDSLAQLSGDAASVMVKLELDTRRGHPWLLRRHRPRVAPQVRRASDRG